MWTAQEQLPRRYFSNAPILVKPYSCPTCSKVTKVARGKVANLAKNFALAAAAAEALQ